MRRQNPYRDTDEYDGGPTNPCLPIDTANYNEEEIDEKLRTNGIDGLTAEEYILHIRSITRKVPKVMTSNVNPASYFSNITFLPDKAKKAAYNASNNYGCPNPTWEENVQHRFHQTRVHLTLYEQSIGSYGSPSVVNPTNGGQRTDPTVVSPPSLPKRNDLYSYQYYTLGQIKHKPTTTLSNPSSSSSSNCITVTKDAPETTVSSSSVPSSTKLSTQVWFAKDEEEPESDNRTYSVATTTSNNNNDDDETGGTSSLSDNTEDVSLNRPSLSSFSSSLPNVTSSPGTNFVIGPYPPYFSTISQYDQLTVIRLLERLYNYYHREFTQFEQYISHQQSSSSTATATLVPLVSSAVDSRSTASTTTILLSHVYPSSPIVGPALPHTLLSENVKVINSSSSSSTSATSSASTSTIITSTNSTDNSSIVLTSRAAIVKSTLLPTIPTEGSILTKDTTVHHGSFITVPELLWLYALFVRLDKPLLGHMAATIRSLFLLCRRQRVYLTHQLNELYRHSNPTVSSTESIEDKLNDLHSHIAALNILIVITGKYFEQRLPGEV